MSTPTDPEILTEEEADRQVDDLVGQWQHADGRQRKLIEQRINGIIPFCSPTMQNHAWNVTHPGDVRTDIQQIYR